MRLSAGARVGPYEVIAPLGAGGMGEVYRARDTRLGREVALKVLIDGSALDPERLQRFEQEARLAGSLNHPNLVVVHDVGNSEGAPFLITELLQGESLRQRLSRGRLPVRTALDVAAQIAEGLAAAHARGVVHRDIKPENVFLTPEGRAKVLDFGIAKLTSPSMVEGTRNLLDTTLTPEGIGTRPGAVLGTAGYMSPEQVRGEPVDARTDIFSIGSVLHEMLTGAKAFPGSSFVESGHAILESEPAPLPDSVPASVDLVVRRCLEKEPSQRFQSAADLAFALRSAAATSGLSRPLAPKRRGVRTRSAGALVAAVLIVGASVGVTRWVSSRAQSPALPSFETITSREGAIGPARFSPEGRVVFSAAFDGQREEVFSHASGTLELQRLGLQPARLLSVSRKTGEMVVLLNPGSLVPAWQHGTLARVGATGGVPREIADDVVRAEFLSSGELAIVRGQPGRMWIERPPGKVVWSALGWISDLRASPTDDRLVFVHHPGSYQPAGEIVLLDESNHATLLTPPLSPDSSGILGLSWMPDGGELRFTQFDRLSALGLHGGPPRQLYAFPVTVVLEDISPTGAMLLRLWDVTTHLGVQTRGSPQLTDLSWFHTGFLNSLSRDGRTMVFSEAREGPFRVFVRGTDGSAPKALGDGLPLALSPDGRTVAAALENTLELLPVGAGTVHKIPFPRMQLWAAQWTSDGKRLLVAAQPEDREEALVYPVDVERHAVLPPLEGLQAMPRANRMALSLDDRWLAISAVDGTPTIYPVSGGSPRPIKSFPVGLDPVPVGWSAGGDPWLFVRSDHPARLARVSLETSTVQETRPIPFRPTETIEPLHARITPDGSTLAVGYYSFRDTLVLMEPDQRR